MSPSDRGKLLWKLALLIEQNSEEFAEIESIDNGKPVAVARMADVPLAVDMFRYMGGWATKVTGSTIPLSFPGEFLSLLVYRYLGLKFVSRSWFNLDITWAVALVLVGALSFALSLSSQQ
jgi:phenylacetaldehyde dehydrogenase